MTQSSESATQLFFALLRQQLGNKNEKLPEQLSQEQLRQLFVLSNKHDLAHMTGAALLESGLLPNDEIGSAFQKQIMLASYRCEGFLHELKQLRELFEEEQIPFIVLKGSVLRSLYPKPWMRTSCDMDILVKKEDMDRAQRALENKLSYSLKGRTGHDVVFTAPGGSTVELHFSLIEEDRVSAKDAERQLENVWSTAESIDNKNEMRLSEKMMYLYHIVHMVKHIQNGGCGVRPFMDLYLLLGAANDKEAAISLCSNGELRTFNETARSLSDVWFDGKAHSELSRELEQYILFGGVYGNTENRVAVMQSKSGGKLGYMLKRLFLPMRVMREMFPVLRKHPYLIPFFHAWRWVKAVLEGRGKDAAYELGQNISMNKGSISSGAELMKKLGL